MENFDLISAVQPSDGWFAIVGIKDNAVKQSMVETREEADRVAAQYLAQECNVFFGVAKFKTDAGRTKDNVLSLRALWLDIDCGEAKAVISDKTGRPDGYATQREGAIALLEFRNLVGLPKPIIVSSGRGIHAYWPLDRDVTREEWEPAAERLRDLCYTHNFYVDPAVFDASRILRIPGTYNYKDSTPKPVEVMRPAESSSFDEIVKLMGVKKAVPKKQWEPTELGKAMSASTQFNFSKIMTRSAKGDGCNQLLHAYTNRATIDYYEWFHAISVAAQCEDADKAVHMMSEGHPDYDPDLLDAKVSTIRGATSCAKFEGKTPALCQGCKWKGQILGPKYLGKVVKEATSDLVDVVLDTPEGPRSETLTIPKYPFPYFRGEGGGIWRVGAKGEDGTEADPILVYPYDFYALKRMRDAKNGEIIVFRRHLPQDGVEDFLVPLNEVTSKDMLRKAISTYSIVAAGKTFDILMDYTLKSVIKMQDIRKMEIMRNQFGWADNNSKFIIGDQEISKDGVLYSPPSNVTANMAKQMGPVGSLDKWKEVWALYGRPGMEGHAFAALSAFGAPLLRFLRQTGAAINLVSPESGTGKTTALRMAMSVYGHPTELIAKKSDTLNAKMQWLAILRNLPFCVDEITNMPAEEFSELVYGMSQGKGKERMTAGGNELRINDTTWQTISLCSSNASFYEKLTNLKGSPDGEMMRLIEYRIQPTDAIATDVGKAMFDQQLMENYGHAGPIFIKYVLENLEETEEACMSIQARLDRELQLTQRERFWSAGVAGNLTAGFIAKMLGLIDWDMNRLYQWACSMVVGLREEIEAPATNTAQIIGDFINRYMQNILVVDDVVDQRSNMPTIPRMEPKGELVIRFEPDTKLMFITAKKFKEYCVIYQINYKETLKKLKDEGVFLRSDTKRMTKGMKVTTTGVQALFFDTSVGGFLDMGNLLPKPVEANDESAGS
jgi:hypothetical protein